MGTQNYSTAPSRNTMTVSGPPRKRGLIGRAMEEMMPPKKEMPMQKEMMPAKQTRRRRPMRSQQGE